MSNDYISSSRATVAQLLECCFHLRQVLGLILAAEVFQGFYSVTSKKCQDGTLNLAPGRVLSVCFLLSYPILSHRDLKSINQSSYIFKNVFRGRNFVSFFQFYLSHQRFCQVYKFWGCNAKVRGCKYNFAGFLFSIFNSKNLS